VKDAQRHGVAVLPIDVAHSGWSCSLEAVAPGPSSERLAVRLGLRTLRGLSSRTGERLVAERQRSPFANLADWVRRVAPKRHELELLAESGALAGLDPELRRRRSALWQVSALERDPRSLFAGASPPSAPSPLPELSPLEVSLADYRTAGLTPGPHVMAHLRADLKRRGVLPAAALGELPNGRFVRTAGHVIVRQRPGAAQGFCFVTLEDETGTANGVLTPQAFARLRSPLHAAPLLEIAGPLQNVDGVVHVRVQQIRPLPLTPFLPDSHDYR